MKEGLFGEMWHAYADLLQRTRKRTLGKSTEIHHNSAVSAVCVKCGGILWIFPMTVTVIRIHMSSRNSLYNAHSKLFNQNNTKYLSSFEQVMLLVGISAPKKNI